MTTLTDKPIEWRCTNCGSAWRQREGEKPICPKGC